MGAFRHYQSRVERASHEPHLQNQTFQQPSGPALIFEQPVPGLPRRPHDAPIDRNYDQVATPAPKPTTEQDLAVVFTGVRSHFGYSQQALADMFHADIQTILALENCRLDLLPEWRETSRIVCRYFAMLHIDPAPTLSVLRKLIDRQQEIIETPGRRPVVQTGLRQRLANNVPDALAEGSQAFFQRYKGSEPVDGDRHGVPPKKKRWFAVLFVAWVVSFCIYFPTTSQWSLLAAQLPPSVEAHMLAYRSQLLHLVGGVNPPKRYPKLD